MSIKRYQIKIKCNKEFILYEKVSFFMVITDALHIKKDIFTEKHTKRYVLPEKYTKIAVSSQMQMLTLSIDTEL